MAGKNSIRSRNSGTQSPFFPGFPLAALALLAGCALGPDYKRPQAAAIPAAYAGATQGWKIAQPRGQLPKGNWWDLFSDPALDALETQAVAANQQLKAAVERFAEARATMDIARAGLYPNASIAGGYTRNRTSPNAPLTTTGQAVGQASTYNDLAVPLDLSYEVDLWGRVRRSVESARARAQASADDLEAVKLSIQAEVAVELFWGPATHTSACRNCRSSVAVFSKSLDLTPLTFGPAALPPTWTSPKRRRCLKPPKPSFRV